MEDSSRATKLHNQRIESIRRWTESDTAKASDNRPLSDFKIKFEDGAMLLAAVTSGDMDETIRLLENNADVNFANVDGLTSLHQACIDENFNMVKLLVERGAAIDACDNEGWTPLHAAATTTSLEIVKLLVEKGANISAVNSEGELPVDLSDESKIRSYLDKELKSRNISLEEARRIEHKLLLDDAIKWQQQGFISDMRDKHGATALHVAASKAYMDVIRILLSIGADINCLDNDGWTPLHVAVYWKHQDVTETLIESNANVHIKNNAGFTIFDIADEEMAPFLRGLIRKYKIAETDKNERLGIYSNKALPNQSTLFSSRPNQALPSIIKPARPQSTMESEPVTSIPQSKPASSLNIAKPPSTLINKPPGTSSINPPTGVINKPPTMTSTTTVASTINRPQGLLLPPVPSGFTMNKPPTGSIVRPPSTTISKPPLDNSQKINQTPPKSYDGPLIARPMQPPQQSKDQTTIPKTYSFSSKSSEVSFQIGQLKRADSKDSLKSSENNVNLESTSKDQPKSISTPLNIARPVFPPDIKKAATPTSTASSHNFKHSPVKLPSFSNSRVSPQIDTTQKVPPFKINSASGLKGSFIPPSARSVSDPCLDNASKPSTLANLEKSQIASISESAEAEDEHNKLAKAEISKLKAQLEAVTKERDSLQATINRLELDMKNYTKIMEENKRLASENSSLTRVITSVNRLPNSRSDRPGGSHM